MTFSLLDVEGSVVDYKRCLQCMVLGANPFDFFDHTKFHRSRIARPSKPEVTMMTGSGTFHFMRTRNVANAIPAVGKSRIECFASTIAAPAMAPVAAAVTP